MALLGTITLRSMDSSDVFLMDNVWEDGKVIVESEVIDEGWNGEHPWESGRVPSDRPLDIEGDSNILLGWFKGINFTQGFTILICVECQEEEEFVSKVRDQEG